MKYRVASVDKFPERQGLSVEVQGKSIAVFRLNGKFFAVDDACPHKGGSLHEGPVNEGVVSCPWHQWQFDLRTGVSPLNPLSKIETYRTWMEGNDIYIEIKEE
jgi:nitrite reductase/ring-hydroxylating ferredoxin subunit